MTESISVTITALQFIEAMIKDMSELAKPEAKRQKIGLILSYNPEVSCSIKLLSKWIGVKPKEISYEGFKIQLPALLDVASEYNKLPSIKKPDPKPMPFFNFLSALGITQERAKQGYSIRSLLETFRQLPLAERIQVLAHIRVSMGFSSFSSWIRKELLDKLYPSWKLETTTMIVDASLTNRAQAAPLIDLMKIHDQEVTVLSKLIEQLTEEELNPNQELTKDDAAKDDAAKDDSAKDDSAKDDAAKDDSAKDDSAKDDSAKDDSSKPPVPPKRVGRQDKRIDLEREEFWIGELGCEGPFEPPSRSKFARHHYLRYELKIAHRGTVAFLDCKEVRNAAYAFWIQPGWEAQSCLYRKVLKRLLEDPQADHGALIGRFEHFADRDWRPPIRKLVESLRKQQ